MKERYQICVPHTSRDFFDYSFEGIKLAPGTRVWVPFRQQRRLGIVLSSNPSEQPLDKLKAIDEVIDDEPLLSEELLNLCSWVARYYQSPLSEVLPLALPKKYRSGDPCSLPLIDSYRLALPAEKAHESIRASATKQHQLIDYLAQLDRPLSKKMINKEGFSTQQLQALVDAGVLSLIQDIDWPFPLTRQQEEPLPLNEEQRLAVDHIVSHLQAYRCFLLQGVTGSGKTEVYLQSISQVLAQGKQVLVLVPEIGLTPQMLARFSARIKEPMAVIHSGLNETERQRAWQLAKEEKVKLIIGTRAAVFTPMPSLGLIVIDEEHDSSLKQMEGVRYSARDTALMRAHLADIPIILGSATPSLESLYNSTQGKYVLLRLNQKALTNTPLHYRLLDIRNQPLEHGLCTPALALMKTHLQQGNQVLVFINRRGFSPVLLCHQCGWMADCRACDSHLTLHRQEGRLSCHHCGLTQKIPEVCGSCHSHELIPIGAGTQRIHEFLSEYFPETEVLRIDRDEVRKKHAFDEHLEKIHSGKAQLIVGTQMLAKGHHFPRLSLVVILDADAGFYNQDFRAIEKLGQLITQVAGRAGRAEHAGEVLIQTHLPQNPMLNLLVQQGYEPFAQALLASREKGELPPYHYLAVIRAKSHHPGRVLKFLHAAKESIQLSALSVFGPAPAPLARKANQYRMQLLIKSPSRAALRASLTDLRERMQFDKRAQSVRWNVDVDPVDLS